MADAVPSPDQPPADDGGAPDRLVFFFSGFDPKGAGFYHRLFRAGAARRNALRAEQLAVGGRERVGGWATAWSARWRTGGVGTHTRVHCMRWDDIVRDHWTRTPWQLVKDYANVYGKGIPSGVFTRVFRQSPAAFWLALFPLGVALASLLAGLAIVGGALAFAGVAPPAAGVLGLAAGAIGWRVVARRIDCEWLLRLYAFTRLQAIGALPALDARQDAFAAHIADTVDARLRAPGAPPLREVLLVGHSTGSILAAAVAARALPRLSASLPSLRGAAGPSLAVLTLGHCIPVATDWRAAVRGRAELETLAAQPHLTWHDYSAPADWAAFWRTTPWPQPARLRGHQASPRFHHHVDALDYAALRRDRREMHLQYLRPPTRGIDEAAYDYFRLTCGPATLGERHDALARTTATAPATAVAPLTEASA